MISVKSLRVDYENVVAVRDLDMDVSAGQVYGLLGPNGAGKTSTIKAIARIVEPTYGDIRVDGVDPELHPSEAWRRIGYMPDFPPVYDDLKVWEYLDVFAAAHLVPRSERRDRVRRWTERIDLAHKRDAKVGELSRGMKQRLVLAKTLLPEPKLLLLDEPASGMDPISRLQMRDLLREAADNGAAVIISSHVLSELDDLCDSMGVMEKGRMVASGTMDEIRAKIGSVNRIHVTLVPGGDLDGVVQALAAQEGIADVVVENGGVYASFPGDEAKAAAILAELVRAEFPVVGFSIDREGLADLFLRIGAKESS
jgi:ABC-2 type transport system ATP-binding protein